jgi:hypothetical protein
VYERGKVREGVDVNWRAVGLAAQGREGRAGIVEATPTVVRIYLVEDERFEQRRKAARTWRRQRHAMYGEKGEARRQVEEQGRWIPVHIVS